MMRSKTTYMRYQTTGESNVYTLGYIGAFRCVSTKLPVTALSGDYRSAMIAAGNTTTRLLGECARSLMSDTVAQSRWWCHLPAILAVGDNLSLD